MRVEASDIVRTGADGSVGITMSDDSLSAGPNSVLSLDASRSTRRPTRDSSTRRCAGSLAVISGARQGNARRDESANAGRDARRARHRVRRQGRRLNAAASPSRSIVLAPRARAAHSHRRAAARQGRTQDRADRAARRRRARRAVAASKQRASVPAVQGNAEEVKRAGPALAAQPPPRKSSRCISPKAGRSSPTNRRSRSTAGLPRSPSGRCPTSSSSATPTSGTDQVNDALAKRRAER